MTCPNSYDLDSGLQINDSMIFAMIQLADDFERHSKEAA